MNWKEYLNKNFMVGDRVKLVRCVDGTDEITRRIGEIFTIKELNSDHPEHGRIIRLDGLEETVYSKELERLR